MEKKFVTENYHWSVEGLKQCIKDNKLKGVTIIVENEHAAAVEVPTYAASVVLGGMSDWCISQHKCSWEQYVSKQNNIQVFFFNFAINPFDDLSLVGATFKKDGKVMCSFTRENHPLHEITKHKNDQIALYEAIMYNNYSYSEVEIIDNTVKNLSGFEEKINSDTVENHLYEPSYSEVYKRQCFQQEYEESNDFIDEYYDLSDEQDWLDDYDFWFNSHY